MWALSQVKLQLIKNIFTVVTTLMKLFGSMAHNGLRLGEGGDFYHKC
jgi:hypothetical protein